jgi:hypothetical protein
MEPNPEIQTHLNQPDNQDQNIKSWSYTTENVGGNFYWWWGR